MIHGKKGASEKIPRHGELVDYSCIFEILISRVTDYCCSTWPGEAGTQLISQSQLEATTMCWARLGLEMRTCWGRQPRSGTGDRVQTLGQEGWSGTPLKPSGIDHSRRAHRGSCSAHHPSEQPCASTRHQQHWKETQDP